MNSTLVVFISIEDRAAVVSLLANPMTVAYTKTTKTGIESKFFDIIAKESVLLILSHYDFDFERAFYRQLNGDKTERKKRVLNDCVRFYVLNVLHRQDGELRQPNSVMTELKMLFARFKEHGIMFSLSTEFRFKGSFSSYLQLVWHKEHEKDTTFGNGPTRQNAMPEDYDQSVCGCVFEFYWVVRP
jgi:hypothetical protein